MAKKKSGHDEVNERLHEALDGLRKDVTRVEIWATALGSFTEPVPEYSPNPKFTLGQAADDGENQPENAADPAVKKSPD